MAIATHLAPSRAERPGRTAELVVELAAAEGDRVAPEPAPRRHLRWGASAARSGAWTALVALVALLATIGWLGLRAAPPPPPPPPRAVASELPERREDVVLERASGPIERLRSSGWVAARRGDRLRDDDTLRTGPGASAVLAIGERSRVTLSDATQLTVREITAAAQRLRLSRGRLSVDHQPDGARVVVVESEDGEREARAGAARFSVLASGAALSVATESGVVRLGGKGGAVEVAAGQQAVSFRGEPPDPATPIPAAVLLKVARRAMGEGICVVDGVAEPGAEVRVAGRVVDVGAGGRFSVQLDARSAGARVVVETRDPAGRVAERRVACLPVAQEQDVSDFAVRWGHDAGPRRR